MCPSGHHKRYALHPLHCGQLLKNLPEMASHRKWPPVRWVTLRKYTVLAVERDKSTRTSGSLSERFDATGPLAGIKR